jgi:hypothetical protein
MVASRFQVPALGNNHARWVPTIVSNYAASIADNGTTAITNIRATPENPGRV